MFYSANYLYEYKLYFFCVEIIFLILYWIYELLIK